MNVIQTELSSRTRLVRVRGGSAKRLLEQFPRASRVFDARYSPAWLYDHVVHDRMELWNVRDGDDSIGFLASYVSRVSEKPSYYLWGLFVEPRRKDWQRSLFEWVRSRARDLGCSHVEFVTPRGGKNVERYLKACHCDEWKLAYTGFLLEV